MTSPAPSTRSNPLPAAPARKRVWAKLVAALAVVVVVLVALLPTIAGWIVPGMAGGFVKGKGKLEVAGASFSWLGPQAMGPVKVFDDKGVEIASFTATVGQSLFALASSSDYGTITVSGKADVVRKADGSLNLATALVGQPAPGTPAPAGGTTTAGGAAKPFQLPAGLAVKLKVSSLNLSFTDEGSPANGADPGRAPVSVALQNVTVDADVRVGQPLTLTLAGSAVDRSGTATGVSGAGGTIQLSVKADKWSDAAGNLLLDPANPSAASTTIDASGAITGLPLAIADVLAGRGGAIVKGLGPTLDATLAAKGSMKNLTIDAALNTRGATATAALGIANDMLQTTRPATVKVSGPALAALAPALDALTHAAKGAPFTLATVPDLAISLDTLKIKSPAKGLDLSSAAVGLTVSTTAAAGTLTVADAKPSAVTIAPFTASIRSDNLQQSLAIVAKTTTAVDGKPAGTLDVNLTTGPLVDGAGKPIGGIPTGLKGVVNITGVDPAVGQPFIAAAAPGLSLRDILGPSVDLTVNAAASGKDAQAADVTLAVRSANLKSDASAIVSATALSLAGATANLTLTEPAAAALTRVFAKDVKGLPKLTSAANLALAVDPIVIPLKNNAPQLASASGPLNASFSIPGQTLVEGLSVTDAAGKPTPLGPIGVKDLAIKASAPLAAFDPASKGTLTASISGQLVSNRPQPLASLAGNASADFAAGRLTAAALPALKLQQFDSAAIDQTLALNGLLTQALGGVMNLTLGGQLTAPTDPKKPLTDGAITATALLDSPKLKTGTISARVLADRIAIDQPATIAWAVDPALAQRFLATPGKPATPDDLALLAPVNLSIALNKAVLSRGDKAGPMKPGVFDLDARVQAPSLQLASAGTTATLSGLDIKATAKPGGLLLQSTIAKAQATTKGQPETPAANNLKLDATLDNLADASGTINPETATLTAKGQLAAFPTALADTLARQDGVLVAALGPTADITLNADHLSRSGGTLDATLASPRASAKLTGNVANQTFVTKQATPITATITQIVPEFSKKLLKAMPIIGSIEKKSSDKPALLTVSDAAVPLAGDLSKLNAQINLELGDVNWAVSDDLAPLFDAAKLKTQGKAGQRLEPLKVVVASGIATYQSWSLPLGEFKVRTEGTYNLMTKQIDVITWVPAGALAQESIKALRSGQLAAIAGDTLLKAEVPIRTRGTSDKKQTAIDFDLFAKNMLKNVKTSDVIEKGLEKGLDSLLKKKPKN